MDGVVPLGILGNKLKNEHKINKTHWCTDCWCQTDSRSRLIKKGGEVEQVGQVRLLYRNVALADFRVPYLHAGQAVGESFS